MSGIWDGACVQLEVGRCMGTPALLTETSFDWIYVIRIWHPGTYLKPPKHLKPYPKKCLFPDPVPSRPPKILAATRRREAWAIAWSVDLSYSEREARNRALYTYCKNPGRKPTWSNSFTWVVYKVEINRFGNEILSRICRFQIHSRE